MIETSAETAIVKKYNLANMPEEGSEWVGKFFKKLWEDAKREKIDRLGLHGRFLELHRQFRGQKKRGTYPRVGANYIFKTVHGFCSILTEKTPRAEVQTKDTVDPLLVKALDQELAEFWIEQEMQNLLFASVQNMQVYGTTVEKCVYDKLSQSAKIILRDVFNIFPAPGYRMCNLEIPYLCDAYFMPTWDIRAKFNVPKEIHIPADAEEQLFGRSRETTRGGKTADKIAADTASHYPSNYASIPGSKSPGIENMTLVVEIWCYDRSKGAKDIIGEVPAVYKDGTPVIDDLGRSVTTQGVVGQDVFDKYPGGIRKVTICPALLTTKPYGGVLDDQRNPNVNWELVELRQRQLMENGIPVPFMDPETGQEGVQVQPISEPEAREMALEIAAKSYLFKHLPYSATPSYVDTTQWWGFSIIEQLEELQGKAEGLLTKYFAHFDRLMFPIFINPDGSGVPNSKITDMAGAVLRPKMTHAHLMRYVESPMPPQGYLDLLQFVLFQIDVNSMTPEVTEGRRPKGISAASAIVALQDKASTLFQPQIRAIDMLIRNRGRMVISMIQNFGTTEKPIKVDESLVRLLGTDLMAEFKYHVESGSSAPITKAGRRQQYIELFKLNAMTLRHLLEMLEIPKAEEIVEEITEQNNLMGAIQILINAGIPEEEAMAIGMKAMATQGGTGRSESGGRAVWTKSPPASEGMESARSQMDLEA